MLVGVSAAIYLNIPARVMDYLYSRETHYLGCDRLPQFNESKKQFISKIEDFTTFITDVEAQEIPAVDISEDKLRLAGGYISIQLRQPCEDRAELYATVTGNDFKHPVRAFFAETFPGIPYTIHND